MVLSIAIISYIFPYFNIALIAYIANTQLIFHFLISAIASTNYKIHYYVLESTYFIVY